MLKNILKYFKNEILFGMNSWNFSSIIISLLIFLPIYMIIINFNIQSENWMHIKENLLHRYVRSTLYLVVGVGAVSTIIGVGCAWFVTCYDFHGRKVIEWILILPKGVKNYFDM